MNKVLRIVSLFILSSHHPCPLVLVGSSPAVRTQQTSHLFFHRVEFWVGWSGGLVLRCSGSFIVCLGVRGAAASAPFVQTQAAASVGVLRGGTDSFSSHTGLAGDSWGGGALPGVVQANPITPQLMSLLCGCGPHLEPAQATAQCSSGHKM